MNTKKLTSLSMLLALSLIIFIVEAQLPPLAPVPGIKMGLANIITLVTLVWYGRKEAFTLLMLRIILGSVFTGHLMSCLYSMAGGLLCFLTMAVAIKPINKIWVVSILGAISHNTGQIIAAVFMLSSWTILGYLPILTASAVITGAFTGVIAALLLKNKNLPSSPDKNRRERN